MKMNQIRYFLAVCEHQNFTHAARELNVSQPSLTTAIKKLEGELGGALFLRDRAGCRLTSLGKIIRPRLETIQSETREAKAEAIRHIRLDRVPITVGVGETIGQRQISGAIERFRSQTPEAEIEIIVESHDKLLEGLRDGDYDIIISSIDVNAELYRIDPLYTENYRVVVASDHALSEFESVDMNILANTNMLDRLNCEMRDTLHETCAGRGHSLYATYRSNRVDWLLDLARNGSGAVILPETAIPDDPALHRLSLYDIKIERQVSALRFRHQPSRPEANQLVREMIK